jgi:superoxide dismutase, Cu-Zn family
MELNKTRTLPMKSRYLLALIPLAVLAACGQSGTPPVSSETATPTESAAMTAAGAASPASAVAQLESKSGTSTTGDLQFTATDGGVSITGELGGLTAGSEHGFHVHETGDCSAADASSAGAHWNPAMAPHGPPTVDAAARHLGDIANVKADEDGHAAVTAAIQGATLRDGGANDIIGKAIVVHAQRDDYVTQPSGNSGNRIACGVIR